MGKRHFEVFLELDKKRLKGSHKIKISYKIFQKKRNFQWLEVKKISKFEC